MGDDSLILRDKAGRICQGSKRPSPGRPVGSPDALSRDFLIALGRDFDKRGSAVISRLRQQSPLAYLRLIGRLVRSQRIELVAVRHAARDASPVEIAASAVVMVRERGGEPAIAALRLLLSLEEVADDEHDDVAAGGSR